MQSDTAMFVTLHTFQLFLAESGCVHDLAERHAASRLVFILGLFRKSDV